ncbi:U32 family peptidase [uncultured Methanobrevibacter sp.]|uniref:U32 family peptidase n=1 Tax=uncultured Methanobrevibacter sp. TaxID=253161 RepID=UPI0026136FC7|nr:U32 family peptidase [uncultured Methanobrevibacter sp.]
MKIPELLAPVGSMEHLKVAINAGASSIYLSGKKYGARKFAKNFTLNEINEAVNTAHLHNVKVYVTVNTLIKEDELPDVMNYLSTLYSIGVDAVLVQDLGLIELINKYLPNLKVHASTQITAENQLKLNYLENKGIKRIVLPREMRKDEIKNLKTSMELEIFVHGALCYSYSGQCLMSSFKGGRSGNRGSCAQPCRQKYRISCLNSEDYYLSPQDLSLYNYLKEIAELNISCIKIEGRMRNKEYLAIVVSNYRKALNKLKSNKTTKSEEINLVFNRGLCDGQFNYSSSRSIRSGHIGLKLGEVYNSENNQIVIKLNDNIKTIPQKGDGLLLIKGKNDYGLEISQNPLLTTLKHYKKGRNKEIKDINRKDRILIIKKVKQNKKHDFNLNESNVYLTKRNQLTAKVKEIENKGESFIKSKLLLTFSIKNKYPNLKGRLTLANKKEIECEVKGKVPFEKPLKRSVDTKTIKKQLLKVDKYPYEIIGININYDGTLFIPLSEINKIRRDLFKKLENKVYSIYSHEKIKMSLKKNQNKHLKTDEYSLSYYTNNLDDLNRINNVNRVYLEIPPENPEIIQNKETYNINYMVTFLQKAIDMSRGKDFKLIWKWPDIAHDNLIKALNKVKGILTKLHYEIEIMNPDFTGEYGSYSMNITNNETINSLKDYKILTLSPELKKEDLKNIMDNCRDNSKLEIIVQGSIELMKTRNRLFTKKETKKLKNNLNNVFLMDNKNNKYPIHKSLSNEELIISNSEDVSLLNDIDYLKSIDLVNFAIDGRWKDKNYLNMIEKYAEAIYK